MKRIYEIGEQKFIGEPEEMFEYAIYAFFACWILLMVVQVTS